MDITEIQETLKVNHRLFERIGQFRKSCKDSEFYISNFQAWFKDNYGMHLDCREITKPWYMYQLIFIEQ